jgi:hypothetical protein
MATVPTITTIQKTECIGNSLVTINTNYDNIKNSIAGIVTTDLATINNTLDTLTTFTNAISSAQLAKAWVKFRPRLNVTGSLALDTTNRYILNSYNVVSVYREDAGNYLITLAKPIGSEFLVNGFVQPYYSGSGAFTGTDFGVVNLDETEPFPSPGNQSCRVVVRNLLGALIDPQVICLTFNSY